MRIANLVMGCVAVAVCAWFVQGARQAHDLTAATAILTHTSSISGPQSAHVASLLRSAATLNPDVQVDLERAKLALAEHEPARAKRIAGDAARAEPHNVQAWYALAAAAGHDHTTFFRALDKINVLAPPPPRAR